MSLFRRPPQTPRTLSEFHGISILLWLCASAVFAECCLAKDGDQKNSAQPIRTVADDMELLTIGFEPATTDELLQRVQPQGYPEGNTLILPPVEDEDIVVPEDILSSPIEEADDILEIPIVDDESSGEDEDEKNPVNFLMLNHQPFGNYRQADTSIGWIPGNGQNFGMVQWSRSPYLDRTETTGLSSSLNITWLSGPQSIALPARVYDMSMGFQHRGSLSPLISYDLYTSIGIYSDFEGSAREGVRFPSHAVGSVHMSPWVDLVLGADFRDRDDISVLPVVGLSIRNPSLPRLRMDLVFPRPRIDFALSDSKRMYATGYLGGDTWDVDDGIDHVVTYRDYRVMLGFETADDDGDTSSIEFGYVFGRRMELRGQRGHTDFDDAFVIRIVTRM